MMTRTRLAAIWLGCVLGMGMLPPDVQAQEQPAAEREPEYSKGFRKNAGKVQDAVQAKDWPAALEGIATLEQLPDLTSDDRKVILSWKLTALQGSGDRAAFVQAVQEYLDSGLAAPEQIGPMHQQLAAWYSQEKDAEKTLFHYQKFVEATPDPAADELETLGRLHLQAGNNPQALEWLTRAIDTSRAAGEAPRELWFQLRDRVYVETEDRTARLANLEELVKLYPKREYYSRILALYSQDAADDRIVMLNAYRLALAETGLETVGQYLNYADYALALGSPGEAVRSLERGMADGVVPSAGSNAQMLQEAKAAVAMDRKNLPKDAQTAAANPKGEVDVKVGLGFFSLGDWEKAVETVKRGLGKGGVKRVDDANLLLGAALMELGRHAEARSAFEAASAAAGQGSIMQRIAALWSAYAARAGGGAGA